jgi:hypothetical protein
MKFRAFFQHKMAKKQNWQKTKQDGCGEMAGPKEKQAH